MLKKLIMVSAFDIWFFLMLVHVEFVQYQNIFFIRDLLKITKIVKPIYI